MQTPDIDSIIQKTTPTVMVPTSRELEPLKEYGQRYLVASDGLWIEIKRAWVHIVWPVALNNDFPIPYGLLEKKVEFAFSGKLPVSLLYDFLAQAKQSFPLETAAWVIWDSKADSFKLLPLHASISSHSYLELERPSLGESEHLIMDIHSHGKHSACFSPEDDRDDRFEVKIAAVVGNVMGERVSMKFRLCTGGRFVDLNVWGDGESEGGEG